MPNVIPFQPSTAYYSFATVLDGNTYTFRVHWNHREDAYYFDLLDQFGNLIIAGIKVVLGVELGWRCQDPRFPPGAMAAADTSGSGVDPGFADLGGRVIVLYYSTAEILAGVAAQTAAAAAG